MSASSKVTSISERQSAQHYDVAVIGMQRSGIVAAALLAKRGRRVLLVDNGESNSTYRRKGLHLPMVPQITPSLRESPHYEKVCKELDASPLFRSESHELSPCLQAILPEHRVALGSDASANIAELDQEFPGSKAVVESFFAELERLNQEALRWLSKGSSVASDGSVSIRRAGSLMGNFYESELYQKVADFDAQATSGEHAANLSRILLGPLDFFAHLLPQELSLLSAVRLLWGIYKGTMAFADNLGGMSRLLVHLAEEAGVTVAKNAIVREIHAQGGGFLRKPQLVDIAFENNKKSISADFFIANTYSPFSRLLPPGKVQGLLAADESQLAHGRTLFTVNLVMPKKALPLPMGPALLLLNGRQEGRDGGREDPQVMVRQYAAQKGDIERRPGKQALRPEADLTVLSCASPVDMEEIRHDPTRLENLRKQILAQVRRLVPFMDEHLVDMSVAMETAAWDKEDHLRRLDPLSIHPFYRLAGEEQTGLGGRTIKTPVKNLVHGGHGVLPGLGMEGEFACGLALADRLFAMAGKRWRQAG